MRQKNATSSASEQPSRRPRKRESTTLPAAPRAAEETKIPFDIHSVIGCVREAVKSFRKAALFELYEEDGFTSPFEQLIACILSIRTLDETTVVTARRLFSQARSPSEISALAPEEIDHLIRDSTF